jgi:hypothetical protein
MAGRYKDQIMAELDLHNTMLSGFDRVENKLETMRSEQRQDIKEVWEAMRQDRKRCDILHSELNKQIDGVCSKVSCMNGASKAKGQIDYLFWGKVGGIMVGGQFLIMLIAFIAKLVFKVI